LAVVKAPMLMPALPEPMAEPVDEPELAGAV